MLEKVSENSLIEEWDYQQNNKIDLDPNKITIGSGIKSHWRCSICSHRWFAQVNSRQKRGCPQCRKEKYVNDNNRLTFIAPRLLKEWDYQKNQRKPKDVAAGSTRKYWWKCLKSHSFIAEVGRRVYRNYNCPYCSNRKILPGFNDLESMNSQVSKEWDCEKNMIHPDQALFHTAKSFYWKCAKGHSWKASVNNRTMKNSDCPNCSRRRSRIEKEVEEYISDLGYQSVINNRKIIPPKEIDVYIPSRRIAIEVNGTFWHSDKQIKKSYGINAAEYHMNKVIDCSNKEILLAFVWQKDWEEDNQFIKNKLKKLLEERRLHSSLKTLR